MPDAPGYAVRILKFDSNPVLRGNQRVSCGLDSLSGSKNNRKMRFETASRSSRWSFRCKILMLRLSMMIIPKNSKRSGNKYIGCHVLHQRRLLKQSLLFVHCKFFQGAFKNPDGNTFITDCENSVSILINDNWLQVIAQCVVVFYT